MEPNGNVWNTLEATVSYSAWARLTPTLTHVVAYELATSGAEDGAMSCVITFIFGLFHSANTIVKALAGTTTKYEYVNHW